MRQGEKGKQLCHSCRSLAKHKVLLKLLTKIVKHFYNLTSSLTKGKSMKKIQKSKKVHYPVQYFALKSCHLQYMKNKPRSVITLKYTASIFQYFTHIFFSGRGDLLKTLLLKYWGAYAKWDRLGKLSCSRESFQIWHFIYIPYHASKVCST